MNTADKRYIAKLLSLIVSISAAAVIIGWIFDIPALKSVSPTWISMKFSTAFCFLLSGIMLYFIVRAMEGEFDKAQIVIFVTSLTILLFMGTLLFAMIFNVHTGIEEIFIKDSDVSATMVVPGRPSLPTMTNFILIVIAGILTMIGIKDMRPKLNTIGLVVKTIGLSAVAGYIFNVPILYYYVEGVNSAIACHTAALFALLGLGLLCL